MHWPAAFPSWSSAAPARWVLPPRWPSWWATAWVPRTASSSKRPLRWRLPASTQIVALDKTGTITSGEPKVTDILPAEGVTESELLTLAASLEQKSEHPLAKAVLAYAETETIACPGCHRLYCPARQRPFRQTGRHGDLWRQRQLHCRPRWRCPRRCRMTPPPFPQQGKTPLFFGGTGRLMGVIAVADTIKEDSPRAIQELQNMGIRVVMLTGRQPAHRRCHRQAGRRG